MKLERCRLYGFIDIAYLAGRNPSDLTKALIDGGVDIIQVRAKTLPHLALVELGRAVVQAAASSQTPVIINDDIAAAKETGAAGVHLGQEDWALNQTHEGIVGISTHSLEQAQTAQADRADYIGVGPVFPTGTKPHVRPVGLDLVRRVVSSGLKIPFFAIGGITLENLDQVLDAGATRIAVVSAILNAPDVTAAAAAFKKRLLGA